MTDDLDMIDAAILLHLCDVTKSYKKAITDGIGVDVSVQTVGRRVEELVDQGLLTRCFLPDEDYVAAGVKITGSGRDAVDGLVYCRRCDAVQREEDACTTVGVEEVVSDG